MNTKNYHLRDIPLEVYDKLEHNAKIHGRSVNKEIIQILKTVKKEK